MIWQVIVAVIIGAIIGGVVAGFVFYRLGYNKMWDEAHKYAAMHMLNWHL